MALDTRLLGYWQDQRAARERAGPVTPGSRTSDARPELRVVTEAYVEPGKRPQAQTAVLGTDDR